MNSITFNVSLISHLLQMNCCNCAQYFSKDRRNVITAAFCQSAVVSSPWWTTFQQMLGIFFFTGVLGNGETDVIYLPKVVPVEKAAFLAGGTGFSNY